MPVQFKCNCSRERVSNLLCSLGKEEIKDMIETDGHAEAQCHFFEIYNAQNFYAMGL